MATTKPLPKHLAHQGVSPPGSCRPQASSDSCRPQASGVVCDTVFESPESPLGLNYHHCPNHIEPSRCARRNNHAVGFSSLPPVICNTVSRPFPHRATLHLRNRACPQKLCCRHLASPLSRPKAPRVSRDHQSHTSNWREAAAVAVAVVSAGLAWPSRTPWRGLRPPLEASTPWRGLRRFGAGDPETTLLLEPRA